MRCFFHTNPYKGVSQKVSWKHLRSRSIGSCQQPTDAAANQADFKDVDKFFSALAELNITQGAEGRCGQRWQTADLEVDQWFSDIVKKQASC